MTRSGRSTPLAAALGGFVAGIAGSWVLNQFFRATASLAPAAPQDAFVPPEAEQLDEKPTETVARRFVEGLMKHDPLSPRQKQLGGELVHYLFGARWGVVYGMMRESMPALASPVGTVAYGAAVWMVGDNVLLPAFRLSAWPRAYPARNHVYALAGHLAYAAAVAGTYALFRAQPVATTAAAVATVQRFRRHPALRRGYTALRPAARLALRRRFGALTPVLEAVLTRAA